MARYGLAVLLVAVASLFRWWSPGVLAGTPYLAYYPAIAAAAALGGLGPGLLATVLTALCVDFFFVGPLGNLNCLHDPVEMNRVIILLVGGAIVSSLAGLLRITRRLKAQQAETLAVTLASIGDGVIVTDSQGRVTFVNGEAERLTGWKNDDARGKPLTEVFRIVNEQTREPVESPGDKVLRLGTVVGLANHTLLIAKDGREVPIDDSGAPIRFDDGSVKGVVLVFRDFSEQKAAQAALQESEGRRKVAIALQEERQRFNNVLNMLPAYVALLSTDYHVPFANRFFEERFGQSKGRRCYEYLFDRTEPCENCETYKVLKTNVPHRWEWTGPDGRNYDIHDFPFTDVDGSPLIMEVGIDVTERKQAEAALQQINQTLEQRVAERTGALRRSERRYRSFVEVTNQFAWVTDAAGQVVEDVPALRQFTGQTYEEVRAAGWSTALHPDDLEPTLEAWNRTVANRTQYEIEYRMRRHDGVYRLMLARGVPILDEAGDVQEWVGTCVDITERKRVEEELKAAKISAEQAKAAAEEANQAKDRFLAVLSHELRTPLTPVLAAVSLLQKHASPDQPPEQQAGSHLDMIRRNVELEARLIDDLLDLTRIARGKVELDKRPVDLCTVIARAVEVCRPDIEARRLEFGVDAGPGSYMIEADAGRLQQVFWNLLKNAIKFTPEGGCLSIRVYPQAATNHRSRTTDYVIVEVNDSGVGICPEAMPRIFDAFAQADRAITRQFGGLGLGLAISKSLVELHGGTIDATSDGEGKGSSFKVYLPLLTATASARPASLSAPASRVPTAEPRGLRILVVEDHGDAADMMRLMLESEGYQVETAGAVATALDAARRNTFDLLISDLGLPDGSGLDLIRELRAAGHRMPAIALSGYGQANDIQQSHAAGFAAHVIKPVDVERLASVLTEVLSRPA